MTKSELEESIRKTFKGITLENGTGLYEADCIDDYINPSDPVYLSWKQKDERKDWEKLLPLFLDPGPHERVHSGNWFFMDPKGKKFHLPCYLLQDLDEASQGNNPIIETLSGEPPDLSGFTDLNDAQKRLVADFLDFKISELKNTDDYDYPRYVKARKVLENILIK